MNEIPGYSVVREFEYKVANYCEVKNSLSVCNATTAILGIFYALGLSNAEIITTPLTWAGAISGLNMLNCKVRFCDVEPCSLTINPDLIEKLISPSTKAVFSADFLGYPARLDRIKEICRKHNLLLIHDAASSFGSRYRGHYSGYFADVAILSFGARKIFSIGEGGCILTNNDNLYEQLTKYLMHPERQFIECNDHYPFAINTNLNPLAAKYGIDHFDLKVGEIKSKQENISVWLNQNLGISAKSYYQPNFYKVVLPVEYIVEHDLITKDLPFQSLIFEYSNHFGYDSIKNCTCPVAENAFKHSRILNIKT